MSSARTHFRHKLSQIYNALCTYTDEVISWEQTHLLGDIKLRYAIILNAVDDLHFGNWKDNEQAKAIEYFNSVIYKKHCDGVPVPQWLIDKIVNSPDEYAAQIGYKEEVIEEVWL